MKKFTMLMLSLSVLLTACGDNAGGGAVETTSDSDPVFARFDGVLEENITLRVLENDTAVEQGYMAELLAAFNEKYKDYGIVAVDANMDQYSDLANDGPYGYGPDVLYQANDLIMKYVDGQHILPLPYERLEAYGEVGDTAWEAYRRTIGGAEYTFGVPVNLQTSMLYYRKDLLPADYDKNGDGTPDMLESWNALYAYSKELNAADKNKYGYMRSQYDVYFSAGYLFSYGAYIFGEGNTDITDIGFAAGEAAKGAWVLKQQASVMNEECIDNTITLSAYSKLADGTYFCTVTTPDVRSLFVRELKLQYMREGMSEADALVLAEENIVMTTLPALPKSGDLAEASPELFDSVSMGGVNGYAISSYTKYPNAALAFVDFAGSYEMVKLRAEILAIAPCRGDVAEEAGELSAALYQRMDEGLIVIMPSVSATSRIWTPAETFFTDLAKDAFRPEGERLYGDLESISAALEKLSAQVYESIHTLG